MEVDTFDDLYKLIRYQEGLERGGQSYTPKILIEIIDKVKNNKLRLNYITRANNLRFVVEKLLKK